MKKSLFISIIALCLIVCLSACDMEFGGLVGELLGSGEAPEVDVDNGILTPPVQVEPETVWNEETQVFETEVLETWPIDTEPPQTWDEMTSEIATGGSVIEDLPGDLYAGERVTVLGYKQIDLGLPEVNYADVVTQATLERNLMMYQVYGIELEPLFAEDVINLTDLVQNDVRAGQGDFDIVYAQMARAATYLATNGYLVNMHNLPYVSLSAEWWDPFCDEAYGMGGNLPMASGAVTPDALLQTSLIVYNPALTTGLENLPHFVRKGHWNIHALLEAARYVTSDLNGDGVISAEVDRLGFAGTTFETDQAFAAAANAVIIGKDADNLPVYADQNVERINEVYATVYSLCIGEPSLYVSMSDYIASPDLAEIPAQAFAEGRVLFYGTTLQGAIELMGTGASMGILPYPKYSSQEADYRSPVLSTASVVMVPQSARNLKLTGYTLEAMARASYDLYGAAIEEAMLRGLTDADSAEMLELIQCTRTVDFGSVYFSLNASNSTAVNLFQNGLSQKHSGVNSAIKQTERALIKALDKLIDQFSHG
jgi:hypothetical protein